MGCGWGGDALLGRRGLVQVSPGVDAAEIKRSHPSRKGVPLFRSARPPLPARPSPPLQLLFPAALQA